MLAVRGAVGVRLEPDGDEVRVRLCRRLQATSSCSSGRQGPAEIG